VISVLVPTRGRPAGVERLLDSALETAESEVEFIFYVDEDDGSSLDVIDRYGATRVVGPRVVLSETWNRCWEHARFDVAMQCGDDIVFRTDGWDARVLAEFDRFPDRVVFVHGEDGIQGANIGTHGFLHRRWVDAVGYFVPPYFSSDYNDLWLSEVADVLGRRVFLPDVYTEHMHPVAGKAELDQTHRERLARHQRDDVATLYRDLAPHRAADVAKLRSVIDSFGRPGVT
jgi:glycosyltransferase involved in cell wall biosynthesis